MQLRRRFTWAMRALPNSAASTIAYLARRRYVTSRACVNWRRVKEPRRCWTGGVRARGIDQHKVLGMLLRKCRIAVEAANPVLSRRHSGSMSTVVPRFCPKTVRPWKISPETSSGHPSPGVRRLRHEVPAVPARQSAAVELLPGVRGAFDPHPRLVWR